MDSSKRSRDFCVGKDNREDWAGELNKYLGEEYYLTRKHDYVKVMPINEKVSNNKLSNRIEASSFLHAMGLYYELSKKERTERKLVIFLQKTIYVKTSSEFIDNWQTYLDILSSFDCHIILVAESGKQFSFPIPVNVFIKYWSPVKLESKGNKTRIQFHGKVSEIILISPTRKNVFQKTIISELENLIP